jgi:phosphatidate cytidylyltransferase
LAVADDTGSAVSGKKSDLRVRTLSAIVMVTVASLALWLGGWAWTIFVTLIVAGVLWEWVKLARAITSEPIGRALWLVAGVVYLGVAAEILWHRAFFDVVMIILCVIATDIGAYFAGRGIGGPKIAPRISPSKTWAGLGGGMLAAGLMFWAGLTWAAWQLSFHNQAMMAPLHDAGTIIRLVITGALIAIIAQAGDFFESWMKRRAGVKDSGNLIPGHGGLFDRVDGLLAVLFVAGILSGMGRFL